MERVRLVALTLLLAVLLANIWFGSAQFSEQECKRKIEQVSIRQCCKMPQILPPEVVQLCRKRPMPPAASPAEPKPFRVNCHGECVLNVTRVLMDRTFRPEQAQKVLLARALNDTIAWTPVIKVAVKKCYMMQVANVFYLTDVAQNRISSQCIPSSRRFLECAFAMIYRDCPEQHWNYNDDRCRDLVTTFNNCDFLFKLVWDI